MHFAYATCMLAFPTLIFTKLTNARQNYTPIPQARFHQKLTVKDKVIPLQARCGPEGG